MASSKKRSPVKRFGTRYGIKVRTKTGKIEAEQRRHHKCPYCSKEGVKRVSYGIWECGKCGVKFTGRAYTPSVGAVSAEAPLETKEAAKATE